MKQRTLALPLPWEIDAPDSVILINIYFIITQCFIIDLYHTMLEQKILPVQPLIQCEAGRAKTKLFVPLGLKMATA